MKSQTEGNVERVAVGSFDPNSPFYQMNLNDLKPFALLEVNRLDVFPLGGGCSSMGTLPTFIFCLSIDTFTPTSNLSSTILCYLSYKIFLFCY